MGFGLRSKAKAEVLKKFGLRPKAEAEGTIKNLKILQAFSRQKNFENWTKTDRVGDEYKIPT